MVNIDNYNETYFDKIKYFDDLGNECWNARDLQLALDYTEWRNFLKVMEKAKLACINSNQNSLEHFVEFNKSYKMPNGGKKLILDVKR